MTPSHHRDRNALRDAKDKIEAALEQMNKVSANNRERVPFVFVWACVSVCVSDESGFP